MNYGIINNRRPDERKRSDVSSVKALLADPRMREIAKQMGLQPKDFGTEAQTLWQTLNDLSTTDPKRYESFINEQLQDGPPLAPQTQSSSPNHVVHDVAPPLFFTPDPGFVVKCTIYHSVKCQQQEVKLFLNICAHKLIDAPKNPNSGQDVPEDTRAVPSTSSLQIPLVVGKLREITDLSGALCCAVDVVVNPWVLRRSEWDVNFKREVMKLAVQWVQEDAHVRLVTPTSKFIKARYKGGVAMGNTIITSKFRIKDADPTKQRMESPADLLKQISLDESKTDDTTRGLTITPSKGLSTIQNADVVIKAPSSEESMQLPPAPVKVPETKLPKKNKVLIEELPSPSSKQCLEETTNSTQTDTGARKTTVQRRNKSGAVKRGFLNSTKAQLYPKGSSEGRPASAYVNLMSRSKVVDLGEMEQQREAQRNERKESMAFLPTASTSPPASSTESQELDHADHIFEQLCQQAEPDLKPAAQQNFSRTDTINDNQLFGESFEELAKLLAP